MFDCIQFIHTLLLQLYEGYERWLVDKDDERFFDRMAGVVAAHHSCTFLVWLCCLLLTPLLCCVVHRALR